MQKEWQLDNNNKGDYTDNGNNENITRVEISICPIWVATTTFTAVLVSEEPKIRTLLIELLRTYTKP